MTTLYCDPKVEGDMKIDVVLDGKRTPINSSVFVELLENSVASDRAPYTRALERSEISYSELVSLARVGQIPHSLFFAPFPFVKSQIETNTEKLLEGLSKNTFSVNSRDTVEISDVELIVKDLLRKQELLKKNDDTLIKNPIVGLLRRPSGSAEDEADTLLGSLGIAREDISSAKNKTAALNLIIERLEANQVLVSQSVSNFMPQLLHGVKFSGLTIRDAKVPYIFLAGGDHGDYQEPVGRRIFTLILLSVLVARGIFAPVTYDGRSTGSVVGREYTIVGQMLMPSAELRRADLTSLEAIKTSANLSKVTPSAMVVRAMSLGIISWDLADDYLDELALEYNDLPRPQPRQPKPINAVRKYNGREFSLRMLDAYDAGKLSPGTFCRSVCLKRLKPSQIEDFREALS